MGILAFGFAAAVFVWLMERREQRHRGQTCRECGKTIDWVGLPTGWVHRDTGRDWEPVSPQEYRHRLREGFLAADNPPPHCAFPPS